MKAVLMSIQPKWCELIANGKKIVEVRKTKPKLETPFKVYIYCTLQGSNEFFQSLKNSLGEYEALGKWNRENWGVKKGKVIGEFICNEITVAECGNYCALPKSKTLIDELDLLEYADRKTVYGWHISDLVIYDKPEKLSEFRKPIDCPRGIQKYDCVGCWDCEITRPPQSWCYVEENRGAAL